MLPEEQHTSSVPDAASVMEDIVRVDFVKFVSVDAKGNELDSSTSLGYLAYNGHCREFGLRSFANSDSYTLGYDVFHHLQEHHPRLSQYVSERSGFYLGGSWEDITSDGEITH